VEVAGSSVAVGMRGVVIAVVGEGTEEAVPDEQAAESNKIRAKTNFLISSF
jgi:hypothetical protein